MKAAFPLADPSISGQLPVSRVTGNLGTGPTLPVGRAFIASYNPCVYGAFES